MITLIDFNDDLPALRRQLAERVQWQAKAGERVSAIEVGFRLCQAGLVTFHFDTRDKHDRDGEWTTALDAVALELPHWQAAYESAGERGITFTQFDGTRADVPASTGDTAVAGVFGEALRALAVDALARGSFAPLTLRGDCQLDINEFDFMWSWPNDYDDLGRSNLIRDLPAFRLPR